MASKNISEFGLSMVVSQIAMCLPDDLGGLPNEPDNFHLYVIGARPRITLDPTVLFDDTSLCGEFLVQQRSGTVRVPFVYPQPPDVRLDGIVSEWPHSTVNFMSGGQHYASFRVGLFAALFPSMAAHCDLEVLYVGQAFGPDGTRSAVSRLSSHATLQKILAETSRLEPDREVWLVVLDVEPNLITCFDGTLDVSDEDERRDDERLENLLSRPVSPEHQINFAEAALIRYFAPRHNKHFVDTFPSRSHSSYKDCYDLDYNTVAVELDSEPIGCRLFSASRGAQTMHMICFGLHTEEERRSMFDYLRSDFAPPSSIGTGGRTEEQ